MTEAIRINGFYELNYNDLQAIDGGEILKILAATAGAICIAIAPMVGIAVGVGASIVATPVVGVSAGIGAAATMVSAGATLLDYATK
jgi:hypothetical protein